MSCVTQTSQPFRFVVSVGALPEGFCGTPQQLAQAIADRLLIQSDQNFSSFAIGSTAPTSNVGPWLKDCTEWYVWSDTTGGYVPMTFPSIASIQPGFITAWAGSIASIPAGYLLCDGSSISISQYPALYAVIGDQYEISPCPAFAFMLPDLRDRFIVGATQDDAGVAKTNIEGSLTKTGGGNGCHTHSVNWAQILHPGGTGANNMANDPSPVTGSTCVLPAYMALAWIIKT